MLQLRALIAKKRQEAEVSQEGPPREPKDPNQLATLACDLSPIAHTFFGPREVQSSATEERETTPEILRAKTLRLGSFDSVEETEDKPQQPIPSDSQQDPDVDKPQQPIPSDSQPDPNVDKPDGSCFLVTHTGPFLILGPRSLVWLIDPSPGR